MQMGIRPELYKLNIYSTGGKMHDDATQSDKKCIGASSVCLSVCLSTQFFVGVLATRHHSQEVKFDWSSSLSNPKKTSAGQLSSVMWSMKSYH